jgi:hypothetical protein
MRLVTRSFGLLAAFTIASAMGAGAAYGQAAATRCKDGSTSITAGRGACSGHGGVDAAKTAAASKASARASAKAATVAAKIAPKAATATAMTAPKAAASAAASARASVSCSDGTMSKGGRGACSGHGGVKTAVAASAAPAAKAERAKPASAAKAHVAASAAGGSGAKEDNNPAGAIAKCKDGMYSHATHRQGACSRHGGVASWS